ncbi:MAG TPA: glycoside-pentoside-hexuronide (GPH):cation symporter [Candidatus Cryosericum sp.]|nr:glycoside-pentoside-hexuronide (GPH):cation symporter [Candidatus Cryosericum sp.]
MSNNNAANNKLPIKTGICYGLGNLAFASLNTVIGYFMLFYLTDYAGIAPAAVGTMILIARIWDAVNDPIMGTILDNTKTNRKWGQARPYVLFGAIPMALFFVMIFSVPLGLSAPMKLVWSYAAYIGFDMAFTVSSISFLSMPMRITMNPDKRITLAMWVSFLAFPAALISALVPAMVKTFSGPSENMHRAYLLVSIVFAVAAMVCILVTFLGVKEKYTEDGRKENISIFKGLGVFIKSKPWTKLISVTLLMFLFFSINMASLVYYVNYYIKQPSLMAIGGLIAMSTIVVALLTVKPLVKKFGKRKVVLISVGISAAALVARVFLKDHNVVLFLITLFLTFISYGAYSIVKMPLLFDSIEYAEYKTGISAKSIGVTGDTFVAKLAQGFGPAIVGYVLQWGGYTAQASEQPEKLLNGLFVLNVYLPLGCLILIAVLMFTYKIEDEMPAVREELRRKMLEESASGNPQ